MALVTTMQAIVKAEGETYPAVQLVFLRSLVGFISVTPLVWRHRRKLTDLSNIRGHLARVAFNSVALTLNFAAFAALPLALVTAIGFTRPLVLLVMAAIMLGESVTRMRYSFTALGFVGVIVITIVGYGNAAWFCADCGANVGNGFSNAIAGRVDHTDRIGMGIGDIDF